MSLRHLYKDLNELGIYGDLIEYEDRTGIINRITRSNNVLIITTNKYYGDKIHEDITGYHRRMYYISNKKCCVDVGYNISTCIISGKKYVITYNNSMINIDNTMNIQYSLRNNISFQRWLARRILTKRRECKSYEDLANIIKRQLEI